jgi:hypothetical protein
LDGTQKLLANRFTFLDVVSVDARGTTLPVAFAISSAEDTKSVQLFIRTLRFFNVMYRAFRLCGFDFFLTGIISMNCMVYNSSRKLRSLTTDRQSTLATSWS